MPTLHDLEVWRGFEAVRARLAGALLEHGIPAARYGRPLPVTP